MEGHVVDETLSVLLLAYLGLVAYAVDRVAQYGVDRAWELIQRSLFL
jgi:hypothetical protein